MATPEAVMADFEGEDEPTIMATIPTIVATSVSFQGSGVIVGLVRTLQPIWKLRQNSNSKKANKKHHCSFNHLSFYARI